MTEQTSNRPVHYYDTRRHRVACGADMANEHSTKYERSVTCDACLRLLHDAAAEEARSGAAATAGV